MASRAIDIDRVVNLVLVLLLRFEGLILHPYLCPAGVPTIGLGCTHYLDGSRVKLTDPPITREHALILARELVRGEYLPKVLRLCRGVETDEQLAGLVDFAFNVGTGALAASTLLRRVNAGLWGDVPAQLRRWVFAAGKKLRGLVLRREAEILLLVGPAQDLSVEP